MSRCLPWLLAALIAAGCRPAVEPGVGLREALHAYVDDGRLAGAVLLVTRDGEEAFGAAVGWRDVEADAPMALDTIFRIASQSKAIVSVAAMMLEEEGLLDLQAPVGDYLPEFAATTVAIPGLGGVEVVPAERPITILDLLTHTSGVSYGAGGPAESYWAEAGIQGWYFADRDEPIAETVARMGAIPFDTQPGAAFVYGYSTDILGAVLEKLAGVPLDHLLQERVFEPLGMRDTHFYLPPEKQDRLAAVYSSAPSGIVRAPDQGAYVAGPRASFSGGAGLLSTARDYTRFLTMLLNGGELDGVRLLETETVERMIRPHVAEISWMPGSGFGLGVAVVREVAPGAPESVGQFGWGGAYHSIYWVDPSERLTVVYLTQLVPADIEDHDTVRRLVHDEFVVGAN